METNRITTEFIFKNGERLPLMPDLVHKMEKGSKSKPKIIPPNLNIDADVLLNYFCRKRDKFNLK